MLMAVLPCMLSYSYIFRRLKGMPWLSGDDKAEREKEKPDMGTGAGIQADLKTFCAHRVFGMSVIVSVVAENTSRVIAIEDASPDMIRKQVDVLFDGKKLYHFKAQRIMTKNTHGTGCTFSAAIAARLAGGADVREAVAGAKRYVTGAIAHALEIGKGNGPTNHFYAFYGGPDIQRDKAYDYSLYLVADEGAAKGLCLADAVEQAILGGATMVQLREKEASALDFYRLADQIRAVTKKYGVPLIINDRVDVALAVCADGVHVGQRDIPAAVVRRMIGEEMLLGVSAVNVREAVRAQEEGADYLGVGAMFPTVTKPDAAAVSMEELLKIRQAVKLPIVAIGGINRENAARFSKTGVDRLAVASSILSRPDVKEAAAGLKMRFFSNES